ncbi:unnamed protein product, partial [Fusarium fujikuroi]
MDDDNSTISTGSLRGSTASLTSSILEYRHINGRPFQQWKTTESWAPTDDDYQEGQDILDMADEYPSAEVLGTDISAVQPAFVPLNCSFQIEDAQLDWTFKPDEFDFIHIRYLYGAIDDWKKLYRQAFAHLPVGGWPQDKKLKQIGLYNGAFIDHSIDAFAIFPIGEILGWSEEEVTILVSQMRKALKEPRALPCFN